MLTYPGSKTPVKTFDTLATPSQPRNKEYADTLILGTGRELLVKGELKEFFTIGALAHILNRRSVTIRKWEAEGIIPKASFVLPSHDKRGVRRLYTKEQILGLRDLAQEEGLLEPNANGKWKAVGETQFKERALELFQRLQ